MSELEERVRELTSEICDDIPEPTPLEAVFELGRHACVIVEHDIEPFDTGTVTKAIDPAFLPHYAVELRRAGEALIAAAVKCERTIMGLIENEGLNPQGSITRRRFGDYIAEYRLENPYPEKAPDFEARLDALRNAANGEGVLEQYHNTVKYEPKVNRTQLKALAASGGEIGRLCASLFIPKEPVPKLVLTVRPQGFPDKK